MKEIADLEKAISALWAHFLSDKKMQRYAFLALIIFGIITNWDDLKAGMIEGWVDAYAQ